MFNVFRVRWGITVYQNCVTDRSGFNRKSETIIGKLWGTSVDNCTLLMYQRYRPMEIHPNYWIIIPIVIRRDTNQNPIMFRQSSNDDDSDDEGLPDLEDMDLAPSTSLSGLSTCLVWTLERAQESGKAAPSAQTTEMGPEIPLSWKFNWFTKHLSCKR